jgi:hypothetical protein
MKTQKMSLANMQGKLSRAEMKNIMAGQNTVDSVELENCAVSCNSGYFACCNGTAGCHCYVNGEQKVCSSGGAGSASCIG